MARTEDLEGQGGDAQPGRDDDEDELPRPPGRPDLLVALARLDLETASVYDVIAAEVGEDAIRTQLLEFRDDHLRHADELRGLLKARDEDGDALVRDDAGSLLRPLADLVRPLGSGFAIVTLIAAEHLTNASYEAALEYEWTDDEVDFLDRAFLDEQDHLEWLLAQETVMMGEGDGDATRGARPDAPA